MKFEELPEDFRLLLGHLFDPQNPISLSNKLPAETCEVLTGLIWEDPRLPALLHDEEDLLHYIKITHAHVPTVNDHRVRFLFWLEFENSCLEGRNMIPNNIHSLVCDAKAFRKLFLGLPYRAAFLLCRPAGYQACVKETLTHGLKRMREILDMPEYDAKGKLNTKLLELKVKVFGMMDLRVHGAPTQKIHQVNQNLDGPSAKQVTQDVKQLVQKGDMETIRRRIYELEAQQKEIEGRGQVTPVPEDAIMEGVVVGKGS